MEMSAAVYTAFLALVGVGRLIELRISRRNQQRLIERGAVRVADPNFRWMVALHTGILVSAALEVWLLDRPFIPALAAVMALLFLLANAVRWRVIATLADHWNVQVVSSTRLGVVSSGPYRWVRHPNYSAVFVEMMALPLIHTAWITAVVGGIAHWFVLRMRLRVEDGALLADPAYRAAMGGKPRFVPNFLVREKAGAAEQFAEKVSFSHRNGEDNV
jgi:methyltransferase